MRIGILSDTHNEIELTRQAVALLCREGAQALIHCGDLTGTEIVAACAALPCYYVFGNNDADNIPALKGAMEAVAATCLDWAGIIVVDGKRIAITHGHMHTDVRRMLAVEPDYLLTGHSHSPSDRREGPVRRINPGALHRTEKATVAILDLATDEVGFRTLCDSR